MGVPAAPPSPTQGRRGPGGIRNDQPTDGRSRLTLTCCPTHMADVTNQSNITDPSPSALLPSPDPPEPPQPPPGSQARGQWVRKTERPDVRRVCGKRATGWGSVWSASVPPQEGSRDADGMQLCPGRRARHTAVLGKCLWAALTCPGGELWEASAYCRAKRQARGRPRRCHSGTDSEGPPPSGRAPARSLCLGPVSARTRGRNEGPIGASLGSSGHLRGQGPDGHGPERECQPPGKAGQTEPYLRPWPL